MDMAKTVMNRAFVMICICQGLAAILAGGEIVAGG